MTNLLPRLEFLATSLWRRQRHCPHCWSEDLRTIARKHGVVRIVRCGSCRLVFTSPIHRAGAAAGLYERLYRGEGSTTSVPDEATLAGLLARSFAGSDKDFGPRISALRRCARGPRLLEVGSSWGYFLHQARAQGLQATGVEIAATRRAFGIRRLGLRIAADLAELPARSFDLIYSAHTLEHFTDLAGVFPRLCALLAAGGRLVVEVPHFDLRRRAAALSSVGAVHPIGFTPEFFTRNLHRHGFRLVGFFDTWEAFPEHPRATSDGDTLILMADAAP